MTTSDTNHGTAYESAPPAASALIESLRGVGYSLATAIADIIDNSIAANAKNVWLRFNWAGHDSWVTILDDGDGMDEPTLSAAMRLGAISPLQHREPHDLGRFGLGLKTASFSQCRRLTVASRKGGPAAIRRWDLDFIAQSGADWPLLPRPAPNSSDRLAPLDRTATGTLVLWELLDRVVGEAVEPQDQQALDAFLMAVECAHHHLGMLFHRFLDGRSPRLKIYINGSGEEHLIRPWDPFLSANEATIRRPSQRISATGGNVEVQGFILPHKDKLSKEQYERGGGPEGWTAQQGFYVYRNERLLVPGGWLGLGGNRGWTKEEPYKLARLRLDIPNTADAAWKIDIKKSVARPPYRIRERLREVAEDVRRTAKQVFIHRGSYGLGRRVDGLRQAWRSLESNGRVRYRINREHPSVSCAIERGERGAIENMLRVVEETVPVQRIWLDATQGAEVQPERSTDTPEADIARMLKSMYDHLLSSNGMDSNVAKRYLLTVEPFHLYPELVEAL